MAISILLSFSALPQLRELPVIEVLRQVWAEQYIDPPGPITFREKKDLDAAADLIVSPYDTEARFSTKRGMDWIGYVRCVGAYGIPA